MKQVSERGINGRTGRGKGESGPRWTFVSGRVRSPRERGRTWMGLTPSRNDYSTIRLGSSALSNRDTEDVSWTNIKRPAKLL